MITEHDDIDMAVQAMQKMKAAKRVSSTLFFFVFLRTLRALRGELHFLGE